MARDRPRQRAGPLWLEPVAPTAVVGHLMINLRYHIVSLIAVFLALGIGVAMGSTFLDRATVDNLNGQLEASSSASASRDTEIERAADRPAGRRGAPAGAGRAGRGAARRPPRSGARGGRGLEGVDEADVNGAIELAPGRRRRRAGRSGGSRSACCSARTQTSPTWPACSRDVAGSRSPAPLDDRGARLATLRDRRRPWCRRRTQDDAEAGEVDDGAARPPGARDAPGPSGQPDTATSTPGASSRRSAPDEDLESPRGDPDPGPDRGRVHRFVARPGRTGGRPTLPEACAW